MTSEPCCQPLHPEASHGPLPTPVTSLTTRILLGSDHSQVWQRLTEPVPLQTDSGAGRRDRGPTRSPGTCAHSHSTCFLAGRAPGVWKRGQPHKREGCPERGLPGKARQTHTGGTQAPRSGWSLSSLQTVPARHGPRSPFLPCLQVPRRTHPQTVLPASQDRLASP